MPIIDKDIVEFSASRITVSLLGGEQLDREILLRLLRNVIAERNYDVHMDEGKIIVYVRKQDQDRDPVKDRENGKRGGYKHKVGRRVGRQAGV